MNIQKRINYTEKNIWTKQKLPLIKNQIKGYCRSNGRNNTGKITCYHKGGGHKKAYRIINYKSKMNKSSNGIICSIEYDPHRSCFIASIYDYTEQTFNYIIAHADCNIGDIISAGTTAKLYLGHVLKLKNIPDGTYICNISENDSRIKKYSRASGTYAVLLEKMSTYCKIILPSGKKKQMSPESIASLGCISHNQTVNQVSNKAGRSRWLNSRPTVRGVAMNPIDHPHGGGEGKKSGHKYSPWGRNKDKIV